MMKYVVMPSINKVFIRIVTVVVSCFLGSCSRMDEGVKKKGKSISLHISSQSSDGEQGKKLLSTSTHDLPSCDKVDLELARNIFVIINELLELESSVMSHSKWETAKDVTSRYGKKFFLPVAAVGISLYLFHGKDMSFLSDCQFLDHYVPLSYNDTVSLREMNYNYLGDLLSQGKSFSKENQGLLLNSSWSQNFTQKPLIQYINEDFFAPKVAQWCNQCCNWPEVFGRLTQGSPEWHKLLTALSAGTARLACQGSKYLYNNYVGLYSNYVEPYIKIPFLKRRQEEEEKRQEEEKKQEKEKRMSDKLLMHFAEETVHSFQIKRDRYTVFEKNETANLVELVNQASMICSIINDREDGRKILQPTQKKWEDLLETLNRKVERLDEEKQKDERLNSLNTCKRCVKVILKDYFSSNESTQIEIKVKDGETEFLL